MDHLFHNEFPKGVSRICIKREYYTLEEFNDLKEKYLSKFTYE
jgi:hypothetical protein